MRERRTSRPSKGQQAPRLGRGAAGTGVTIYANRSKMALAAGVAGALLAAAVLPDVLLPRPVASVHPWLYRPPVSTVIEAGFALLCGPVVILGLYWMFTRTPLLRIDGAGMAYHPYPLVTRVVRWADVAAVTTTKVPLGVGEHAARGVALTLVPRPETVTTRRRTLSVTWVFSPLLFPYALGDVVGTIRLYHRAATEASRRAGVRGH